MGWNRIVVNHCEKLTCHHWGAKLKQISKGLGPQAGKESFYFKHKINKCGVTFLFGIGRNDLKPYKDYISSWIWQSDHFFLLNK